MHVVTLTTTVTPERTLTVRVPQDIPTGPVEVVVVFAAEPQPRPYHALGDLRTSEFFGMWRDRTDLPDSPALARTLRRGPHSPNTAAVKA
jgi:hypothetical protein